MLTIYHSNKLDVLKSLMAHIMQMQKLTSPMQKEVIVVQSTGMAKWLQIELGQEMGILANVDFVLPSGYLWQLFSMFKSADNSNDDIKFDKLTITWLLMKTIPHLLNNPAFETIKAYLNEDDAYDEKLNQLSSRCADVFDHYLVYRPEWTLLWENDERVAGLDSDQEWQAILWKAVSTELNQKALENELTLTHRASMYGELIKFLKAAPKGSLNLPERIFICGISALPPLSVQVLEVLGDHCDVHLMYTNPCRYYWADIKTVSTTIKQRLRMPLANNFQIKPLRKSDGEKIFKATHTEPLKSQLEHSHPLLAKWGKLAKEQLQQFAELQNVQEIEAFVEEEATCLLSSIKTDILNLKNRQILGLTHEELLNSTSKQLIETDDGSVQFNVCHSMAREVEVLHDYLLKQFQENHDILPKDVVVMVSDIAAYSPYIHAIFGNASRDNYIPFSIADRGIKSTHPIVTLVSLLLELPKKRFEVEEIFSLFASPVLLNRFKIKVSDLDQIRVWIDKINIYWGRDDEWLIANEMPATGKYTWRFGLDRLLLGLTKLEESGIWQDTLAYDGGQANSELVGQFSELITQLMVWQDKLSQPKTLSEWRPILTMLFDDLLSFEAEDVSVSLFLLEVWDQVVRTGLAIEYDQKVDVDLLHQAWLMKADNDKSSQKFLAGKVNFCTLMPMRSIPFKQVCLLGMSENHYPRNVNMVSFDLMRNHTQLGDRSRRDDDRYLFLEAVISAEKFLYISYVGLSIQNNQPQNASIVVNELLDYLTQSYVIADYQGLSCDESAAKMRAHFLRMQQRVPYAPDNYVQDGELAIENGTIQNEGQVQKSYAKAWLAILNQDIRPATFNQMIEPELSGTVDLSTLLSFYRNPIEYFFKNVLSIYFNDHSSSFSNDEPFDLQNKLEQYILKQNIYGLTQNGLDKEGIKRIIIAKGRMPANAAADYNLDKMIKTIDLFYNTINHILPNYNKYEADNGAMLEVNLTADQLLLLAENSKNTTVTVLTEAFSHFTELFGWIQYDKRYGLIEKRFGSIKPKYLIQFWIKHLLLCICFEDNALDVLKQQVTGSTYFGIKIKDKKEVIDTISIPFISKKLAAECLINLISTFYQGHYKALLVLPATCYEYASAEDGVKNPEVIKGDDAYCQYLSRMFNNNSNRTFDEQMIDEIKALSNLVYAPLYYMLKKED